METYSDISGILFSISVPRMEADQIRMKMDSDILNIHFFYFHSVSIPICCAKDREVEIQQC